jgi:peptide/nickel transport system substrate-binding protein
LREVIGAAFEIEVEGESEPTRRRFMRIRMMVVIALIALVGQFALAGFAASSDPAYGGTAVIAMSVDPGDWQPLTNTDDFVHLVTINILSKLVQFAPDYSVIPGLAESWAISEDGLTYTFYLHETTFHDGESCTSEDVVYSMEYFTTRGGMAGSYSVVEDIVAVDDYTVQVTLSAPNAPFLHNLAWAASMILPKHLYEGTELETNPYNKKPVGTGPFKFVEWVPGDHITLEANENYYEGRPYLDRLIFKIIPDSETALAAFDAGEVDALSYGCIPSYSDADYFMSRDDVYLVQLPAPRWDRVIFNTACEKLSDVRVRQAIAHAVDRQRIVDVAFGGVPVAATTANPVPIALAWAYSADAAGYEYNPTRAGELLDSAGFTAGSDGIRMELEIQYPVWGAGDDEKWLLIGEMLEAVGIAVDMVRIDPATWQEKVIYKKEFEISYGGGGITDPDMLNLQYSCKGSDNGMGYCNPAVDLLFAAGSQYSDPTLRASYYHAAGELIAADVPSLPLFAPVDFLFWSSSFDGDPAPWYWFDQTRMWKKG